MYAMVNAFGNVYLNVNQGYMASLMAAPMIPIELVVMRAMYRDRRRNMAAVAASLIVFVASWTLIRQQTAVADGQFLRSMIPHHGAAILMCGQAPIQDAAIKDLCRRIVANQQAEVEEMKAILARLGR